MAFECKFQIMTVEAGYFAWTDFGRVVSPLNIGETSKNETTSAYNIMLYFKGTTEMAKEALKPGQICRINMGSRIFYFVVVDGGKNTKTGKADFVYHSYSVQEAICYFREVAVQLGYFSFNEYTLPEFVTRLLAMSDCDYAVSLSTSGAGYTVMLGNWKRPAYQIASAALLDNLLKLGSMTGVRLKLEPGASSLNLKAYSLKGSTTISTINGRLKGQDVVYKGSNYAAKVIADVENMSTEEEFWHPGNDLSQGLMVEPDTEEDPLSATNAVLNLRQRINRATTVRIFGFGKVVFSTDPTGAETLYDLNHNVIVPPAGYYSSIDPDARNDQNQYAEVPVVDYREWLRLEKDYTHPVAGVDRYQNNTLYFKDGETKIFNMSICNQLDENSSFSNCDPICYRLVGETWEAVYTTFFYHRNYYLVRCSFYTDARLVQKNTVGGKRMTMYSQDDNVVSGKALMDNLHGHAASINNAETVLQYDFDSIADVPQLFSIYQGQVISDIKLSITNHKISAELALSDDLVAKSEYLSPDAGVVLPGIPLEKTYNRVTNYGVQAWLCGTRQEAQAAIDKFGADTYFNDTTYSNVISYAMKNGRATLPRDPKEIRIKTGTDSSLDYSAGFLNKSINGNSVLLNWKAIDPVTIGMKRTESGGTGVSNLVFTPVGFVREATAKAQNFHFRFANTISRELVANYPRINSTVFGYEAMFDVDDVNYYHDPAEVPDVTLQLSVKNYHASTYGEVQQAFLEETDFMKDTLRETDNATRYVGVGIWGDFEITDVMDTVVASKLHKIVLFLDDNSLMTDETDVVIKRRIAGVDTVMVHTMGVIGSISGTGQRYVELYLAYTK